MDKNEIKKAIESGKTVIGIELGSTRIKSVLIGDDFTPIVSGSHDWENQLENGVWTYSEEAIWEGVRDSYAKLAAAVKDEYGVTLCRVGAIGFSAMMHGYLVFDEAGKMTVEVAGYTFTVAGTSGLTIGSASGNTGVLQLDADATFNGVVTVNGDLKGNAM